FQDAERNAATQIGFAALGSDIICLKRLTYSKLVQYALIDKEKKCILRRVLRPVRPFNMPDASQSIAPTSKLYLNNPCSSIRLYLFLSFCLILERAQLNQLGSYRRRYCSLG